MILLAIIRSALLFCAAGLCEVSGGYLVWLWLRDARETRAYPMSIVQMYCHMFDQGNTFLQCATGQEL
jgi:drug/metabolite transporter superfamily protein YnfA